MAARHLGMGRSRRGDHRRPSGGRHHHRGRRRPQPDLAVTECLLANDTTDFGDGIDWWKLRYTQPAIAPFQAITQELWLTHDVAKVKRNWGVWLDASNVVGEMHEFNNRCAGGGSPI